MPRLIWSIPARDDLRRIDAWLTCEARPEVADRILSEIRMRSKVLEDFPKGGRPHRNDTRILRVFGTPYLPRYRIIDGIVEGFRAHHEREDWFVEP